jgi:hypothetical protein
MKTTYATIKGFEVMRMIRKRQCILAEPGVRSRRLISAAERAKFCAIAANATHPYANCRSGSALVRSPLKATAWRRACGEAVWTSPNLRAANYSSA